MKLRKVIIRIGATHTFRALFVADSHIAIASKTADAECRQFESRRAGYFPMACRHLQEAVDYARRERCLLIHGGDLIDFPNKENLSYADCVNRCADVIFCPGNHEFSAWSGERVIDYVPNRRASEQLRMLGVVINDVDSRIINGVQFVTLNNSLYQVSEAQHAQVQQLLQLGLPAILICHIPFFTPRLCESNLSITRREDAFLVGLPLEISSRLRFDPTLPPAEQWRNSAVLQRAQPSTLRFVSWLRQQPQLKAIFSGHCHHFFAEPFSSTAIQYVTGPGFLGEALEIEFR